MSVPPRRIRPYLRPLPSFRHKTQFTIQSIFSGRLLPGKGGYFGSNSKDASGASFCKLIIISHNLNSTDSVAFASKGQPSAFFIGPRSTHFTTTKSCHLQKQDFSFGFFVGSMLGPLHCDIEVSPVEITLLPFFPRCNAPPAHTKTLPSILSSPPTPRVLDTRPGSTDGPLVFTGTVGVYFAPLPFATRRECQVLF